MRFIAGLSAITGLHTMSLWEALERTQPMHAGCAVL